MLSFQSQNEKKKKKSDRPVILKTTELGDGKPTLFNQRRKLEVSAILLKAKSKAKLHPKLRRKVFWNTC